MESICEADHDIHVTKFQGLPNDYTYFAEALQHAAVAVIIDISGMQFYSGGIFQSENINVAHGALLVGYNDDDHSLILQNSWGKDWGVDGTIQLAHGNTAGVLEYGSYPYVA